MLGRCRTIRFNVKKGDVEMPNQIKLLIFTTGWMVFRAVGAGLFLILGAIGSDRSASSDWTIAFLGDFVIGTTALFLAFPNGQRKLEKE